MKRILIANRGEIAVRINRACADAGYTSIAVYADQDADALHARMADEAIPLEGSTSRETYLNIEKIVQAAVRSGADAVHPGYGFLSEHAEFARAVEEAGLTWIGPPPACIDTLGDKVSARKIAERVGAPLVQGTEGPVSSHEEVHAFVTAHGLPIVIKAAHGGGGRGMRVVHREEDVAEQFDAAVREAVQAFGRGECFVEQFLESPRHIEVQILADNHGETVAVGTRDCSLQRRNQKLIEEAPAPFLTDEQRAALATSAEDICRAAGYRGAGTVEFLLAPDGRLSFLEVNTRLQVEHPITEETAGVDLVDWQFRIAAGERLDPELRVRSPRGHAFEFRINAEDVGRGFLPGPGRIALAEFPSGPGVRVDAGVTAGSTVPDAFDSLIAKIIVWGEDRAAALRRARRVLPELRIEGVPTVLPFHRAVLEEAAFVSDTAFAVHTRWIETDFSHRIPAEPIPMPAAVEETLRTWIEVDGRRVRLGIPRAFGFAGAPEGQGGEVSQGQTVPESRAGDVPAPVAGTLTRWLLRDGAEVTEGTAIAVIEAMKMEAEVHAVTGGTLQQAVEAGASVAPGERIATID